MYVCVHTYASFGYYCMVHFFHLFTFNFSAFLRELDAQEVNPPMFKLSRTT